MKRNDACMELIEVPLRKLKIAEYNPRRDLQPGDSEYEKIKRSIQEFGYVDPIIINSDHTVIGGHQRLKVLEDLGFDKIPVIVIEVDKTKEKALNIALNKIQGEWDYEKLENLLRDLQDVDFDLLSTGFDDNEIYALLNADDEGFSFDDGEEGTDSDEVDDMVSGAEGQKNGLGWVCNITFTEKEDAEALLRYVGYEDAEMKGRSKLVFGDKLTKIHE